MFFIAFIEGRKEKLYLYFLRWEGSIKHALIGCYFALPLQLYGINAGSYATLLGMR
jgi:hypothetical protein